MIEDYSKADFHSFKHKKNSAINEKLFNKHVNILKCNKPSVFNPQPDIPGYVNNIEHFGNLKNMNTDDVITIALLIVLGFVLYNKYCSNN